MSQRIGGIPGLGVWQCLLRHMVEAHQRMGDGDAVAHWTYIMLAMDADAIEWEQLI